jgi:Trm5-related predicted tRNA methylase
MSSISAVTSGPLASIQAQSTAEQAPPPYYASEPPAMPPPPYSAVDPKNLDKHTEEVLQALYKTLKEENAKLRREIFDLGITPDELEKRLSSIPPSSNEQLVICLMKGGLLKKESASPMDSFRDPFYWRTFARDPEQTVRQLDNAIFENDSRNCCTLL